MAYKQFKIQGQTTADVAIATVSVDYDVDGFITFTDTESNKHRIPVTGPFAELVKEIFTGTGGIDAGTTNGIHHGCIPGNECFYTGWLPPMLRIWLFQLPLRS